MALYNNYPCVKDGRASNTGLEGRTSPTPQQFMNGLKRGNVEINNLLDRTVI